VLERLLGCGIVGALGLTVKDLFFDSKPDPIAVVESRRRKTARERMDRAAGCQADTLREAERLIRSARGIDISAWSNEQLDAALNELAAAHAELAREGTRYE
jgi:hypothetical protein